MPVFTDNQIATLNRAIASSLDAHIDHETCEVTLDDLLLTFVKPEHQAAARIAGEIYITKMYHANMFGFRYGETDNPRSPPNYSVRMEWTSTTRTSSTDGVVLPWLPPGYCGEFITDVAPAAFHDYMVRVNTLVATYNRMALLLKVLNTRCTTAGQLVFVWPAIKQIVDRAAEAGEQVDTIKKMVGRRNTVGTPLVTPLMRQWCQETGAALTYLQLMGKAPHRSVAHKFAISFTAEINAVFDNQLFSEL